MRSIDPNFKYKAFDLSEDV